MANLKQIIAMGGGGFSTDIKDLAIEKYILKQSKKPEPKICLLPTASGDSDSYIERFYRAFTTLNCKPSHLPLFWRTPDLESVISGQDIIYVGGGNTKSMLAVWREWEIPEILRKAWEQGIILAGTSAGAICWFEQGITDSWDKELAVIDGMGLLTGSCCPHYNHNARKEAYLQLLASGQCVQPGLALCEWSFVHFHNEKMYRICTSRHDSFTYLVCMKDKVLKEELLKIDLIS